MVVAAVFEEAASTEELAASEEDHLAQESPTRSHVVNVEKKTLFLSNQEKELQFIAEIVSSRERE